MEKDRERLRTYSQKEVLEELKDIVSQLRYGSVTITVHDGKIVQIETTQKNRYV
ncbi:MAG: YezD family protein [bacterium]|nr:YezD family protein [bacterium]